GREMLFYKQPGTEGILHGVITNDGTIDENDAMSYRNYTGLESVDCDFNGYVEKGDLNKNGVIDANDISYVLRQLDG
ncbi:dockerin type I domain-containing protein, partial [Enterococcus faecalis]|uniref:dockerin type I domain-containing protein n=1 Tax=Enterococcus faecalis TaxID=1351 RepID=UPI003CC5846C